jgi:lipoate-protein ligase A
MQPDARNHSTAAAAPICEPEPAAGPAVWLDLELPTVEENLALDEALLDAAHAGLLTVPVVRAWMATMPAVVLGSSSRIDEEVDRAACAAAGVSIVRRTSGGLSVVLGPGCLMWSVITPRAGVAEAASMAIDAIHAATLEPLAAALRAAGRMVVRQGTSDLALRDAEFAPTPRKVSGNALRVRRHGVLYHGTLLDDFDLDLVGRVLRHPPREPGYRAGRPHGAFLANLGLGRLRLGAAVQAAFRAVAGRVEWPQDRVETLVRERYTAAVWTERL